MKFKEFMVNHVTNFEPAIFLELADDWEALNKWNLTENGQEALKEAFGDDLIQVVNYTANTYSYYWKSTTIEYKEIGDILDGMKNQRDYSKIYKAKGTKSVGAATHRLIVLDEEIPESLQSQVIEPNVTAQLLDLN